MKLSEHTIKVLKSFAEINNSIVFRPGSEIWVKSKTGKAAAYATVPDTFDESFGIYEVKKFLSSVSLFKDPDIKFSQEKAVITNDNREMSYTLSPPETLITPKKRVQLASKTVTFKMKWEEIEIVEKASAYINTKYVCFLAEDGKLIVKGVDPSNPSSHTISMDYGDTDASFCLYASIDSLQLFPIDYEVSIDAKNMIINFNGNDPNGYNFEYFIACDATIKRK